MAKVHESYDAGQFLTGNLNHFTVTKTGMAASDMKAIVETTGHTCYSSTIRCYRW